MMKEKLFVIFKENSGKIIGSLIGLILAIFILIIGLFRTLFIVLLTIGGYFIGDKVENGTNLLEIVKRKLRLK